MPDDSIVIAGHSHITSFGIPLKASNGLSELVALPGLEAFTGYTGSWPRERPYWEGLIDISRTRRTAISWMGNQHNSRFMFASKPLFDFVLDEQEDLIHNATIVPTLTVREVFKQSLKELEWLLIEISATGGAQAIVLGTPPPKEDDAAIRKLLGKEAHFVEWAQHLGLDLATVDLTSASLRLKLWKLLQKTMKEIADSCGATFLAVPPTVFNKNGFLGEQYWAQDATHANGAFGKQFLGGVLERLNSGVDPTDMAGDEHAPL